MAVSKPQNNRTEQFLQSLQVGVGRLSYRKVLLTLITVEVFLLIYIGRSVQLIQQPEVRQEQLTLIVLPGQGQDVTSPPGDLQAARSFPVAEVNTTKPISRYIVYSCNKFPMCGGWADRQKGIVVTYLISLMMNRKFRIDMPKPCDLQTFLLPNEVFTKQTYNIKEVDRSCFLDSLKDAKSDGPPSLALTTYAVDWMIRPGETEGHSIREIWALDRDGLKFVDRLLHKDDLLIPEMDADYVFITTNMDTVSKIKTHPLAKTVPLLSNETSVSEIYRKSLFKLFTMSSGLLKTLEVFMESRSPDTKLVCAQVRMGGSRKGYRDSETFNSMANVKNLMDFFASRYNDSRQYRMCFTSDLTQVVELGQATFPKLVITIPGPITHVDKSKGSDACAGFGHAIVEQTALSTCDVLVISESGFGRIAAFLRNTDQELYLFHDGKVEPFRRDMRFVNRGGVRNR